eukprot:7153123-Pyramimonas_sp.AAC.1
MHAQRDDDDDDDDDDGHRVGSGHDRRPGPMRAALHGPHGDASVRFGCIIGVPWGPFGEPRRRRSFFSDATCAHLRPSTSCSVQQTATYVHKYSHAMFVQLLIWRPTRLGAIVGEA